MSSSAGGLAGSVGWIRCFFFGLAVKETMSDDNEKRRAISELYAKAFEAFATEALWNVRRVDDPTPADALAITQALRRHGRMPGRRLAEQIEQLVRAAH